MSLTLYVNEDAYEVDVDGDMPLLWVLRDELGMTGTKYSCGIGVCGACSVLVDGVPMRSCMLRVAETRGKVTTIEGVVENPTARAVVEAWVAAQVAQCGYCQPGQIINAVSLLAGNAAPSDDEIEEALSGVLCRCGTYSRIRQAVKVAAQQLSAARRGQGTS